MTPPIMIWRITPLTDLYDWHMYVQYHRDARELRQDDIFWLQGFGELLVRALRSTCLVQPHQLSRLNVVPYSVAVHKIGPMEAVGSR